MTQVCLTYLIIIQIIYPFNYYYYYIIKLFTCAVRLQQNHLRFFRQMEAA